MKGVEIYVVSKFHWVLKKNHKADSGFELLKL